MTKEDLIPMNKRTMKERQAIGRKGGSKKSAKKTLANTYKGLLANKKLTDRQRHLLILMKDKKFIEVITELINETVEEHDDPARRDKAVEQLQRMLPQKILQINANVDNVPDEVFDCEAHLKKIMSKEDKKKCLKTNGKKNTKS